MCTKNPVLSVSNLLATDASWLSFEWIFESTVLRDKSRMCLVCNMKKQVVVLLPLWIKVVLGNHLPKSRTGIVGWKLTFTGQVPGSEVLHFNYLKYQEVWLPWNMHVQYPKQGMVRITKFVFLCVSSRTPFATYILTHQVPKALSVLSKAWTWCSTNP